MLEILKKQFNKGDTIKITLINDKEVIGVIDNWSDSYIIIKSIENKNITIFERMIGMWENIAFEKKERTLEISNVVESESQIVSSEFKKAENTTLNKNNGVKVVGRVNLEEIERQSLKEEKKKAKTQYKLTKKSNDGLVSVDFTDLVSILKTNSKEENEKTIPANGVLIRFFGDRSFGFIKDKYNCELYFNYYDVIDPKLRSSLVGSATNANIPVLFTLQNLGNNKEKAIFIQKPKKIKEVLIILEEMINTQKYDTASGLIEQILESFPENLSAIQFKDKIRINSSKLKPKRPKRTNSYGLNYPIAKKAKDSKNYDKAIKLFNLALKNGERIESTIKDLAQTYLEIGEIEKGVILIEDYLDKLPKSTTTYNFLEHYYASAKKFEESIKFIDKNLDLVSFNDKKTYSRLLTKKAFCFIELKNFENAEDLLEEAISLHPENMYSRNLLDALTSANSSGDYDEVDKLIQESDFTPIGGLSKVIKNIFDKNNEYFGVPPAMLDTGDFVNNKTLQTIRNLVEKAGRARPKERAKYLITEAKLLEQLEPEKENVIRSIIARHCNAMALSHIFDSSDIDVVRFYYVEAFTLETVWDSLKRQVVLFLNSFLVKNRDLIELNSKKIDDNDVDNVLDSIVINDLKEEQFWNGLVSILGVNNTIYSEILERIFIKPILRNKNLEFLRKQGCLINKHPDKNQFFEGWNNLIKKKHLEVYNWSAAIKSLTNLDTIEGITNQIQTTLNDAKIQWFDSLDIFRLGLISGDSSDSISELLKRYLKLTSYDDKERTQNQIKAQINQLLGEIDELPTKLSYEGFIPLLEKIAIALEKSFDEVIIASTPRLSIKVLGNNYIIGEGNIVPVKIVLSNGRQCSPISQLKITVEESADIIFPAKSITSQESIKGGDEQVMELAIKVSEKVINDRATTIDLETEFKIRGKEINEVCNETLALRLYSKDEFENLPNPYGPLADGGPVEDNTMFYGRDEFIRSITKAILSAESKQIIIYGQKRSGKSSVLYHLKEKLDSSKDAFCINFSLGDIAEDINTGTFYHKILSLIEETLEDHELEGNVVPFFESPNLADFDKHVAADLFRKSLKRFKRACKETLGWENKRLIVMIDEFTYLYTSILKNKISDNIMQQWKAVTENKDSRFSVVLVGQDVVPKFKAMYPNPFGVIEDKRLTYLNPVDAKELIEKPIWDHENNQSRYLGNALNKILDYTSCNPYYIQMFCARLVDHLNKYKINEITEVEVKLIADGFISGEQSLTADKFDNLLTAGDADLEAIPVKDTIQVLKQIADNSKNIPMCSKENISLKDKDLDSILQDLRDREVVECPQSGYYKIKVKLFQEWLLKQ